MNRKKILKLLVASSTIAGGIGFTTNAAQATEVNNDIKKDRLTEDTTSVSQKTLATIINVNSNLNVRKDAGINYDTIGYVCNNDEVEILSEKGDWYRISFNGREGYVSKKYVSIENKDKSIKNAAKKIVNKGRAINVNSTLNIRQAADVNSSVLGTLKNGDTFEIISKSDEWYNIKSNNIVGFVGASYVQEVTGNETTIENVIEVITESYQRNTYESKAPTEEGVVVNVSTNLRVRSGPDLSREIIGYLLKGQEVTIKGQVGDWYNIVFNGRDGYVSKEYVKKGHSDIVRTPSISIAGTIGQVINISSSLNIRSGAGTGHSIVGTLHNGVTVDIIEKSGDWYHISHNGLTGYVSAQYLKEVSAQSNSTNVSSSRTVNKTGQVVNISSSLNIRSGAGTGHSIVGTLTNGQTVNIIEKSGDWYHISHNGITGYVSAQYLQEVSGNISTPAPAPTPTPVNKHGKVVNISSSLNIRSGAGTGHSIVGTLHNGETVDIIEKSGDWYHINHNGITGYVSAQYLQEVSVNTSAPAPTPTPTPTPVNKHGKVINISSSLNIRSGAGTGHSIVGTLHNGETVDIIEKSGDWYHISHNGITGYVSAQYLQEVSGNISTPAPAPTPTPVNKHGKVVNISSSLNIRSGAGTGHSIVGTLSNGVTVNIIEKSGDWYHISHNGITGYVSVHYLQETTSAGSSNEGVISSGKGIVYNITTNLRIRAAASTNSLVLGYLENGNTVDILGASNGWTHIEYKGITGYVSSEYIRSADSSSSVDATAIFNKVYSIMREHVGSPYVWGGSGEYLTTNSLNVLKSRFPGHNYSRAERYVNQGYRAFDCSGLMQWGFRQVGINIGRTTYDQIYNGYEVSLSNLQPGDLLFNKDISHVGMYVGNGQWIEAPNSSANIRVVAVPWSRITRARRVIG